MNAVSPASVSTRHTWLPSAARPSVHTVRSGKLYLMAGNVPLAAEEQPTPAVRLRCAVSA